MATFDYLLLEGAPVDGDFLLLEGQPEVDGGKLILEESPDPPIPTIPTFNGPIWFPDGIQNEGTGYNVNYVDDWGISGNDPDKVWVRFNTWTPGEGGTTMNHSPIVEFDRLAFERAMISFLPYENTFSLQFNGSDEYLTKLTDVGYGLGPITVAVWIKTTDTDGAILASRTNPPNFYFGITGSALELSNSTGSFTTAVDVGSFRDGNWHQVVFTNDPNVNERIFVDGVEYAWASSSGNLGDIYDANGYFMGRTLSGTYYAGLMDELVYFSAELSPAQIVELYNGGAPYSYFDHSQSENLVEWYRMGDGDDNPTITDLLYGLELTMVNMDNTNFVADVA